MRPSPAARGPPRRSPPVARNLLPSAGVRNGLFSRLGRQPAEGGPLEGGEPGDGDSQSTWGTPAPGLQHPLRQCATGLSMKGLFQNSAIGIASPSSSHQIIVGAINSLRRRSRNPSASVENESEANGPDQDGRRDLLPRFGDASFACGPGEGPGTSSSGATQPAAAPSRRISRYSTPPGETGSASSPR